MEIKAIKDTKLGLYSYLNPKPTVCVPWQNKGFFLDLATECDLSKLI